MHSREQYGAICRTRLHRGLLNLNKRKSGVLHIDATGSVVRKVHDRDVYCYAIVVADDEGSYPLAVMLSESHTTNTINYFLGNVNEKCKILTGQELLPPAVVTDFSWALLKAGLLAFNNIDLKTYLEKAWDSAVGGANFTFIPFAMCRAHVAKGFSVILKKTLKTKKYEPRTCGCFQGWQSRRTWKA